MKYLQLFSEPKEIFKEMIKDISSSKNFVYLETYVFDKGNIGKQFLEVLIKKAKQGIKIKLLIDSWESTSDKAFFKELTGNGAEVRFFREFQYVLRIFTKNHERNHRKLLLIDNNITYIGSTNISHKSLKWRELVLRLSGDITLPFVRSFMKTWESHSNFNSRRMKSIFYKGFEIIQDFPSYIYRLTEKKHKKLIDNAEKEIRIETPYFIPTPNLINALSRAVKRGVNVIVIVPHDSNHFIVDVLRNRYLGRLYKEGIKIFFYKPHVLHSKLLIIDNKFFLLGSSNFDYRSFIYQYEINFFGKDPDIISALKDYSDKTLSKSEPFDYLKWKQRSSFTKIIELFIHFIRKFL